MLYVLSEETERVVGAGRMSLARDLGARLTALRTQTEVLDAATREPRGSQALDRRQGSVVHGAPGLIRTRTPTLPPG